MKKCFLWLTLFGLVFLDIPIFSCVEAATENENIFSGILDKVDEILNDGTEYAVFLAYPEKSSKTFLYHSHSMRSASMIKVFILAAVMEKVAAEEMNLEEIIPLADDDKVGGSGILTGYEEDTPLSLFTLLELMITESDNTATNIIIRRMGMNAINDYIARQGYKDTILQREMMDMEAVAEGRENYSSVEDLGNIFMRLYNHRCVDYVRDELMLDFLKGQTDMDCFPAALPGRVIAHKTGALPGLYDDGGIIYGEHQNTVLVIMTENFMSEDIAIERMRSFAEAVTQ